MAAQYTPPRRDQKGIAGTLSILGTTLRARSRVRSSNDAPSRGILTAETHQTVENQSEPESWSQRLREARSASPSLRLSGRRAGFGHSMDASPARIGLRRAIQGAGECTFKDPPPRGA